MERSPYLFSYLITRYIPRVATDWNFDRQNNLFPCTLNDLGLFTLGLDHVVEARGLPQLTRVGLTFSPQLFGPLSRVLGGISWMSAG